LKGINYIKKKGFDYGSLKADSLNRLLKKYNPLFLEEYLSPDFFVPNIIRIVDDAVRRDIEVCKGAIGWRENRKGTEVLCLYDEFISECGLQFVPMPICDEVYYIDPFDRKRFIKLDCVFKQAHEEKLAELEHIAFSLGAKSCVVEIEEKEITHEKKKKAMSGKDSKKGVAISESYETELSSDSSMKCISRSESKFKGSEVAVVPTLKWFAHDNNIKNLIDSRCNNANGITSKSLTLSGATSATISRKAACSVDAAVADMGISQNYSMEDKSVKENATVIKYYLEF